MRAKFTKETKLLILKRDRVCIWCKLEWRYSDITDYHHVYFWLQAETTDDRNHYSKWIWLCRDCHNKIHHTIWDKVLNNKLINYLKSKQICE